MLAKQDILILLISGRCITKTIFFCICMSYSKLDMDLMPGFRFTWWYTGDGVETLEPEAKYLREEETKQFIR